MTDIKKIQAELDEACLIIAQQHNRIAALEAAQGLIDKPLIEGGGAPIFWPKPTEAMILTVAKAMYLDHYGGTWETAFKDNKEQFIQHARVAIAAAPPALVKEGVVVPSLKFDRKAWALEHLAERLKWADGDGMDFVDVNTEAIRELLPAPVSVHDALHMPLRAYIEKSEGVSISDEDWTEFRKWQSDRDQEQKT